MSPRLFFVSRLENKQKNFKSYYLLSNRNKNSS